MACWTIHGVLLYTHVNYSNTCNDTSVHAPLANNNNQLQISIKLVEPKLFTGNTMQALHGYLL